MTHEPLGECLENPWKAFKHITDKNEAIVLVQGGVEEVDVLMVNYFDERAPEFEIAESMSDDYYRIKVRFKDSKLLGWKILRSLDFLKP